MAKDQQPEFVQWMPYVLDALRELGGSGTPREVSDTVARLAGVPEEKRYAKLKSGIFRFPNQVGWAKQRLIWEGLVSSPKPGLWMLTDTGKSKRLSYKDAGEIFREWAKIHANQRAVRDAPQRDANGSTTTEAQSSYQQDILEYLQALHPSAFERFCADLLKDLGLERVEITGGSGDQGIDGEGYLPVGPLVTTKIAFQCKRYSGAVGPKAIREFQGAIGR